MNILERHYRALEKNKELNKVIKKRNFEKYLEKARGRSKERYVESKLKVLRGNYSGIYRNGNA